MPLDLLLQAMTVLRRPSLVDCVNNEDALSLTAANEFYDEEQASIYVCTYTYSRAGGGWSIKELRNIHVMLKHSGKQIGHNIDIRQHVKTIINSTRPR